MFPSRPLALHQHAWYILTPLIYLHKSSVGMQGPGVSDSNLTFDGRSSSRWITMTVEILMMEIKCSNHVR